MKFADSSRPHSLSDRLRRVSARGPSAVAGLFVLAIGCSGVDNPADLPQCQGPITMSVSSGTTPFFSWTPRCMAGQVVVGLSLSTGYVTLWAATGTANTNSLRPPIRYGTPPSSSSLGTPVLVTGGAYRVVVLRATGDSTAPFQVIGSADFVP